MNKFCGHYDTLSIMGFFEVEKMHRIGIVTKQVAISTDILENNFLWHLSIALLHKKEIVLQSIDDFPFLESKMQQKWKLIDEMPAFEIKWSRDHGKEMIIIIDSCDHMFPTSFFFQMLFGLESTAHSRFLFLFCFQYATMSENWSIFV